MVEEAKIKLQPYGEKYSGKHNGWAYQLLNDDYEGIHLGVCCKDFLQDIVWSELTQKQMSIYGQTSTYLGILDKQDRLKLCMYPYYFNSIKEPNIENIEELGINLQAFLNEIEIIKGYDLTFIEIIDNKLIIEFSKEWISKPLIFSLFTLFCRIGVYYDGNLETYFKDMFNDFKNKPYLDNCDMYNIKNNKTLIYLFIENKLDITQKDWIDLQSSNEVHNSGFFSNIQTLDYVFDKE